MPLPLNYHSPAPPPRTPTAGRLPLALSLIAWITAPCLSTRIIEGPARFLLALPATFAIIALVSAIREARQGGRTANLLLALIFAPLYLLLVIAVLVGLFH